MKKNSNN